MTIAPAGIAVPSDADILEPAVERGGARLRGLVRDIRVDAQDLQRSLSDITQRGTLTDATSRAREVTSAFTETATAFETANDRIEKRFNLVRQLLDADAVVYDAAGDLITQMENAWRRATTIWSPLVHRTDPAAPSPDADTILRAVPRVQELVGELVFNAAFLTIPPRLDRHLRQLRIGQALDFNATFADELPRAEDRERLLRYLATHPAGIAGIIDADHGLVLHASTSQARRRLSYFMIVGAAVLGGVVTYVVANLGDWVKLENWPVHSDRSAELLIGYVLVIAGAVAHVAVQVLKQGRIEGAAAFTALEEWTLWMHVKELAIVAGIVTLWIGFIGLAVTTNHIDWLAAFAVGYSIDSVADLYLQRFQSAAAAAVKSLTPATA